MQRVLISLIIRRLSERIASPAGRSVRYHRHTAHRTEQAMPRRLGILTKRLYSHRSISELLIFAYLVNGAVVYHAIFTVANDYLFRHSI